jgi:hypothetical protein
MFNSYTVIHITCVRFYQKVSFSHHQKRHAFYCVRLWPKGVLQWRCVLPAALRWWPMPVARWPGGQAGGVQQQTSLLLKVLIVYIDWYLYGFIKFYCIYILYLCGCQWMRKLFSMVIKVTKGSQCRVSKGNWWSQRLNWIGLIMIDLYWLVIIDNLI